MPLYLVVTADIDGARRDMERNDNLQARGRDRGFLPNGRQVLIMHESAVAKSAHGFELAGFEYRLTPNTGAHDGQLNAMVVS